MVSTTGLIGPKLREGRRERERREGGEGRRENEGRVEGERERGWEGRERREERRAEKEGGGEG